MHLLPHRVRLVGELLEESVVDAQDVVVGVEVFLAVMEVGHLFKSLLQIGAASRMGFHWMAIAVLHSVLI